MGMLRQWSVSSRIATAHDPTSKARWRDGYRMGAVFEGQKEKLG
jgi:hypothetical protein